MNRVRPVTEENASSAVKPIFEDMKKKMGRIINIFANMANSPETLKAFVAISEQADQTSIPKELREKIALAVGQANNCNYCLSAHSTFAKSMGISDTDIVKARQGTAVDKKSEAILRFVKTVVQKKAEVSDEDVQALKNAGISDKELVEIVLLIVVNMFTNYFNKIINTEVDFPLAEGLK